ncbi:allophanate hydrolase [Paramagnetospirillum marisnigri]|uniref:Allophanate hydrolase n=1 Tax=Paramagnetospirillum marisnigri TaxID=1285242 RepID=A0A178MUQ8_9PROT|nr:biotin-dependent carboxyltransferase family protein [Paramagnetospirillum marisnigri]OAN52746.1 allophanate hydrolase [Paramagnetospirillum marisnigri]
MTALRVVSPGLNTTVQDLGRFGYQAQGVPVAGVLDPVALRLANALVGNAPGEAGLELCALGPRLAVVGEGARLAVVGPVRLTLTRDGESCRLDHDRAHLLRDGDVLALGAVEGAATAVLAVEGGFDLEPVLGSLSTYSRAALGPLGGKALSAGAVLPLRRPHPSDEPCLLLAAPFDYGAGPIRVMPGPQADRFTDEALALFLSSDYAVAKDADRMGLRLEGPGLEHRDGAGIPSDGLVAGCIQVPGNGQPIVLLADHQTVGGYAKIATVISADLPRLGRAVPGTRLRFSAVSLAEAQAARRTLEQAVAAAVAALRSDGGGLDLAALYSANLVSGMVSGEEP